MYAVNQIVKIGTGLVHVQGKKPLIRDNEAKQATQGMSGRIIQVDNDGTLKIRAANGFEGWYCTEWVTPQTGEAQVMPSNESDEALEVKSLTSEQVAARVLRYLSQFDGLVYDIKVGKVRFDNKA